MHITLMMLKICSSYVRTTRNERNLRKNQLLRFLERAGFLFFFFMVTLVMIYVACFCLCYKQDKTNNNNNNSSNNNNNNTNIKHVYKCAPHEWKMGLTSIMILLLTLYYKDSKMTGAGSWDHRCTTSEFSSEVWKWFRKHPPMRVCWRIIYVNSTVNISRHPFQSTRL